LGVLASVGTGEKKESEVRGEGEREENVSG